MKTRAAIAAVGLAVTSLFFIDLCNFIFDCGCASLWAGADAHCNIHTAATRHCPVCSHGVAGYAVTYAAIVLPQLAAAFLMRRGSWLPRLALVLALFPLAGAAVMSVAAWVDGYPIHGVVLRHKLY